MNKLGIMVLSLALLCSCAAQRHYSKGIELIASGRSDEGVAALADAVEADPADGEHLRRYSTEAYRLASELLRDAESASPRNAEELEAVAALATRVAKVVDRFEAVLDQARAVQSEGAAAVTEATRRHRTLASKSHRLERWTLPQATEAIAARQTQSPAAERGAGAPRADRSLVVTRPTVEDLETLDIEAVESELVMALRALNRLQVLRVTELSGLAEEMVDRERMSCFEDAACIAEVTRSMGTDLVLNTAVTRIENTIVVTTSLVESKSARVRDRATTKVKSAAAVSAAAVKQARRMVERTGLERSTLTVKGLGAKPSFAVLGLQDQGAGAAVAEGMSDALTVELSQFDGATVFSKKDMAAMLTLELQKQMQGCDDVACMAEIGGALGARYLVTGSVSRLDARYMVTVRIIDTQAVAAIASQTETFLGPADELLVGMRFLLRRLFDVPVEGRGQLRVTVVPPEAEVVLNEEALTEQPELGRVARVPAGKHLLRAELEGYFPLQREGYVEPARVTHLQIELKPQPTPWYRSWWFWTLAGSVVAGATATAVVLSQPDSGTPAGSAGFVGLRGE